MDEFGALPLEVRLSAYLDGQVTDEQRIALDDLIEKDVGARQILDSLIQGSAFGNRAFEDMLEDPVPLRLVRAIKDRQARPASGGATPSNDNIVSFMRFVPQAIAASAVLLLAGGYTGYFIGIKNAADMPAIISETSGLEAPAGAKTRGFTFDAPASAPAPVVNDHLVPDIVGAHEIYTRQPKRLVEIAAADSAALVAWLSEATGVEFKVPDLSAEGLTFKGARLLALSGKPTGALYYADEIGQVTGIYFLKGAAAAKTTTAGGNVVLSGSKGDTGWFIVSQAGAAALTDIAEKTEADL